MDLTYATLTRPPPPTPIVNPIKTPFPSSCAELKHKQTNEHWCTSCGSMDQYRLCAMESPLSRGEIYKYFILIILEQIWWLCSRTRKMYDSINWLNKPNLFQDGHFPCKIFCTRESNFKILLLLIANSLNCS